MIEATHAGASAITSGAVTAALLIFLGAYGFIISERIHRTIIALFGGSLMILAGIYYQFYNQERAIGAIDFNTIGLLIGMMIIVSITKETGLFQYVAICFQSCLIWIDHILPLFQHITRCSIVCINLFLASAVCFCYFFAF